MAERTLDQKIDALTEIVGKGLTSLDDRMTTLEERMGKGFAAVGTQVNSIRRDKGYNRTTIRLADLEEEVFGKARA